MTEEKTKPAVIFHNTRVTEEVSLCKNGFMKLVTRCTV